MPKILSRLGVRLWLFPGCGGGLWAVSRVGGLARAPRLLGFGLLVGFSGALLVVSALDMVCDCHLGSLLRSWGGCWWFLWGLCVLVGLGVALSGLLWGGGGGCGLCPRSRARRARLAFRGLSSW